MKQLFIFSALILPILGGCAVSSEFANAKNVDNAILLQNMVLEDPLYVKILITQQSSDIFRSYRIYWINRIIFAKQKSKKS